MLGVVCVSRRDVLSVADGLCLLQRVWYVLGMAKKPRTNIPDDAELRRLSARVEKLGAKVAKNEFKSEMGGSRLADLKLRYQQPKLDRAKVQEWNRVNSLLQGRTVDAGTKSSLDSLRKIVGSSMRGGGGGVGGAGLGQGRAGGGGFLRGSK